MKTFNDWVKVRYHKPSDDLKQPVDKQPPPSSRISWHSSPFASPTHPNRPSWYPESSFAHQTE